MIEADRAFVLVHLVEGGVHAIVGACIMLGEIGAAHTGERACHESLVFVTGDFPVHIVLRLVMSAAQPVDALALAGSRLLIHLLRTGLLPHFPYARGLLSRALALMAWPWWTLRIDGGHRDVARCLSAVVTLHQ